MSKWESEDRQIDNPYHCTTGFEDFLARQGCWKPGTEVLDMGAGIGAALHFFKAQNPEVNFLGADYNQEKVDVGNGIVEKRGVSGITFETADWMNLPQSWEGRFDGVISIHALCCFRQFEVAFDPLFALKPRWVAINSLFYDGPLDVLIHIRNHNNPSLTDDNPDADFNIFSLDKIDEYCTQHGYELAYEPFFPPQEIPRREDRGRGTYTMKTEIHDRTQFSGPVHLPWHFIVAKKKN